MQAYSSPFARVYNAQWGWFARDMAPRLMDLYAHTAHGEAKRPVLDLCCGTGQLAHLFLGAGFAVTGVDLSEAMLAFARENNGAYLLAGRAHFLCADAADFALDERFGLAVSTFDALNHLPGEEALFRCLACVHAVLLEGGLFAFDLNTRAGLERWSAITVTEREENTIITRGLFDGERSRAFTRISGFTRLPGGLYERFEETVYNTAFDLGRLQRHLLETGWQEVRFTSPKDLQAPVEDPEAEPRVFVVARK